jgi:transposase
MKEASMVVDVGVDSHKSSFCAAVVDDRTRTVATREFANTPKDHRAFVRWVQVAGRVRVVGIEGSGNYGAGLARFLLGAGIDVVEVPAFLSQRERRRMPSRGKSDVTDAICIARVVGRGEGLAPIRYDPLLVDLKLLCDHRDQLVRARTRAANRTHKLLVAGHPGYEAAIPKLTANKDLCAVMMLVRGDRSVRADIIREHVAELRRLDRRIAAVTKEIVGQVLATKTSLIGFKGVGFVTAARILGEVGHRSALGSPASFAMFTGTAPLQASSGTTTRHRLNRGGNRKLNCALHTIAVTRSRCDDDTKAYLARRRAEGKTKREAIRCLKRQLSNVVYRILERDFREPRIAA